MIINEDNGALVESLCLDGDMSGELYSGLHRKLPGVGPQAFSLIPYTCRRVRDLIPSFLRQALCYHTRYCQLF